MNHDTVLINIPFLKFNIGTDLVRRPLANVVPIFGHEYSKYLMP